MDSNGNQRKRGGRMAKNTNVSDKSPSHNENIENSAVAISPTLEESESANNAPASECRRSSRKKIIKFDVRDLLNKNRKTHKIQIEARIDSNAPSTSKASAVGGAAANLKTSTSRADLLSKHKTFLEKSAIFRRYSISQEQKPPPPLPIPPLLSKSTESKDASFCGTPSSQEFLSHALIKPKEPTSLIVAQIESNKPTPLNLPKRRIFNKSPQMGKVVVSSSEASPIVQQKKRGRPAKIKQQTFGNITSVQEENATKIITPEKAKNWKEYKACLAQQSSSSNEKKYIPREKSILSTKPDSFSYAFQLDTSKSDDDGSFSGFQFSKDDISCDSPCLEKITLEKENSMEDVLTKSESNDHISWKDKIQSDEEKSTVNKTTVVKKDIIGEKEKIVKPNKKDLNLEKVKIKGNQNKESFEIVKNVEDLAVDKGNENTIEIIQSELIASKNIEETKKIPTVSDGCAQEEKASTVTSKVEVITKSSCEPEIKNNQLEKIKECVEQIILEADDLSKESKCNKTPTSTKMIAPIQIIERVSEAKNLKSSDILSKVEERNKLPIKIEESTIFLNTVLQQPSTPPCDNKSLSRTSSSSESENASDRSSYSSEPFSTMSSSSSSPRSYKSGDKVKVSIKRISLPKSPSTSSQTSTSEELNNAEIVKRKPPVAKRSKRLQKKLNDSVNTESHTENIEDCFQEIQIDSNTLKRNAKEEFGILATELPVEETKLEIAPSEFVVKVVEELTSNEKLTNPAPSEIVVKVGEELTSNEKLTTPAPSEIVVKVGEELTSNEKLTTPAPSEIVVKVGEELTSNEKLTTPAPSEIVVKVGEELTTKVTALNSDESSLGSEIKSSESNESSNLDNFPNIEKNINRKSLRNRKNNNCLKKDEDAEKTDCKETQKPLVKETTEKEQQLAQELKKAKESSDNAQENSVVEEKRIEHEKSSTSDQSSDKSENNKQRRNTRKAQTEQNRRQTEKPTTSPKEEICCTEEKVEIVVIEDKEKNKMINKAISLNDQTITEIPKSKKSSKSETSKVLNIEQQNEAVLKLEEKREELPKQSSPKHMACQEGNAHSTGNVSENLNKTKSPSRKPTEKVSETNITPTIKKTSKKEVDLEIIDKTKSLDSTSTKRDLDSEMVTNKNRKEIVSAKQSKNIEEVNSKIVDEVYPNSSKKEDEKNKSINEIIQVKVGGKTRASTKSPIQKLTRNKVEKQCNIKIDAVVARESNKEDLTSNDLKVQDEKETDVEAKEKPSTTSCGMKQKDDMLVETEKGTGVNIAEKDRCGTPSTNKEEIVQFEEKDGGIKHDDTVESTSFIQTKIETEKIESEIILEKSTKKYAAKGKKSKEEISHKVCKQNESPVHSATEQDLKKKQDVSVEKSVDTDISLTDELSKTKKKAKENISTKLLKANSEVREAAIPTNEIDIEKGPKTLDNKLVLEVSRRSMLTNQKGLTKEDESGEKNSPASPKRITSKKAVKVSASENPSTLPASTSKSTEETKCLTEKKLAGVNSPESSKNIQDVQNLKSHSSRKLSPETPSEISITQTHVILKPSDGSKQSSELILDDTLQGTEKAIETEKQKITTDIISSNKQLESPLQDNKAKPLAGSVVAKRRGRKPRFKNLHGPEDSETDSSNGKITPIDEAIQQKIKAETKVALQKSSEIEAKKIQEDLNNLDGSICDQDNAKTNLSTSQIKNVSIETNTLLDILRTVQSNTAAALKATKSPTNINKSDSDNIVGSTDKVNLEESSASHPDLLKIEQKERSSIISGAVSPFTVKKSNLSPARSDSNSPLTLKKITPSPTRSNSSSPLTLKKVTRRYERRSRHGEGSAPKTLEETFAEIAAQSSKAVLAAKEFEETPSEELNIINTAIMAEDQVKETLTDYENVSATAEIDSNADKDIKHTDVLLEVAQDKGKQAIVQSEICDDTTENVVGMDAAKTTPTRRGRKPKNRNSELPDVSKEADVISTEFKAESRDEEKDMQKQTDVEIKSNEETEENKHDFKNESLETSFNENVSDYQVKTSSPITTFTKVTDFPTTTEEPLKPVEDVNESNKKLIKTSESKIETEEDNLLSNTVACQEKSDEVRTPKQPIKKRDSLLNKSETKSGTKKGSKKAKSEEEDSLNLTKEDILTKNTATTPPPSKRGRKPKNQQPETPQSSSKKKTKKESYSKCDGENSNEDKVQLLDSECESSLNSSLDKSLDEKLAKKKRQKKLKEDFEAALIDNKGTSIADTTSPTRILNFDLQLFNNSPPPEKSESFFKEDQSEIVKLTCITPVETDEDPDPLKDIEKFIADGVNLLKKDYKLDDDSVDDVIQTTPPKATIEESIKLPNDDIKTIFNTFETPADTPINTPSITPPPKSPSSLEPTTPDENSGVRRSHRIKLITKTPKALVGRGLVRDRERFSIKDDVETKSHYSLDDHLTDLAEVEAKNAKFLKEMEERLSNFQVIKENEYLCERVISREARKMICDCFLTHEEEDRGELGCGEDCLNRLLMIECGLECNVKERCTNKRFQKWLCSPCRVFRTEKKGFGIMADIEILPGEFIMEYVGEVIDTEEFEKRRIMYSQEKNRHYYFMALRSDAIIDATIKGNISRFINHSCDPNAETQKWTVNGELRIGFFSRKSIMPGEEITFNYQYQRYGREAQRCYCESLNCTGWIGQEPTSDEGEQMDDEYDETEDEEEETVNSNLLVHDDEDDSDASVADPEEVQKQLEMAAAQAEVELAPLQLIQQKDKQTQQTSDEGKHLQDLNKSDNEEDSKSKFKKLLSRMAEKVAAKQKQNKREQKLQRKKKSKESASELANKLRFLEDPDIEDEVRFLKQCGLKNQSDTLRLSRLIVRAKLVQTRLNLLEILRKGDLPCRRLFLDYHGLRLLHGWMSEDAGNMQIRLSILQTLETLPIANKTVLTDSKVMQAVRTWSGPNSNLSPNEDSSSSNSNSQDGPVPGATILEESSEVAELQKLALKLITTWDGLPEIFRIPKKERIEQMKEHEREADRQYAANAEIQENTTATDRYRRDRFGRGLNTPNNNASTSNRFIKPNGGNPHKTASTTPENLKNLSKTQRREMFAAKVARDEAEKRLAEERREFETKCRFFGLDPKKTRTHDLPFCVNPATGQWFSIERKPITTPPSYAHVQVPVKAKSTDPKDYQLPAVCSTLPLQWKYAITAQGKIYYYHVKHRIPQWEPPSPAQLQQCELEAREEESESEITSTAGEDSSDDDDDILIGMDAAQLKAYIDRKVEMRRQKRYLRLVDERSISPRREEDRIYNQIEVRKYKENKEKIRKRKEDIRRKRAEALRQTSLNLCTLGSITDSISSTSKLNTESDKELGALPIQDYLLSSDEEIDIKAEVNSPLIDKIVEGDKIVDELDALTIKRQLKRPLPPHRDLSEPSTSSSAISALIATTIAVKQEYKQEYKKRKLEKKEKRKPKEQDAKYRKNKEKFRCEIAGIIVHHLKPYRKETCTIGHIQSNEDFNHLARKLTHFVMIKELKYCESVGQTLVVTESVKSKSREFIKKYMAKYGEGYVKPANDPDFKDIPFTL